MIFPFRGQVPEGPQMASIAVPEELNMIFRRIPGYHTPQAHHTRQPPGMKCAHTRKRAQYRKMYSRHPPINSLSIGLSMTSAAINRVPEEPKHDFSAYSWIPDPPNT